MLRSLLIGAIACSAVPCAQAQDTQPWRSVGDWQIRIDKSLDYGCFMIGSYTQGTLLRIGFDQQNRNGYILVGNDSWRSLQVGGQYELVLRFDNAAPWRGRATARTVGSGSMVFLYLPFESPRFLVEVARRVTLTISYQGNVVTRLPLRGTYAAIQELIRCQQAADAARISNQPQDPFAGGGPPAPPAGGPQAPPGGGGPRFSPGGPSGPAGGGSLSPGPGAGGGPGPGPGAPTAGPGGPGAPDAPSGPTFSPTR